VSGIRAREPLTGWFGGKKSSEGMALLSAIVPESHSTFHRRTPVL